MKPELPTM
jgi:hypothetical protein